MIELPNHPNFPEKLAISPLLLCDTHFQRLSAVKENVFGAEAQREAIEAYGIAGRVWEAAYLMTNYIHSPSNWEFEPLFIDKSVLSGRKRVFLELGSGTGIVAANVAQTVALSGRDLVIATDLPEVCPLLERNLFIKPEGSSMGKQPHDDVLLIRPLPWGSYDHALKIARELQLIDDPSDRKDACITHIICSDLVYFPQLLAPLLRTLLHLTSPPFVSTSESQPQVVISYKIRSLPKETPFWLAFGLWFSFEPVIARRIDTNHLSSEWQRFGSYTRDDGDQTFIFVAHRRPESLNWTIPLDDADLLGGVGAMGTNAKKSDETFETILFMELGEG